MEQVAEAMTRDGELKPISRHGMNRPGSSVGPLVRCSFEETSDVLADAALYGESDDASGITSAVMNGERANCGSGSFDIIMPDWALRCETKPAAPTRQLAKSKVRTLLPLEAPRANKIEFVEQSMWTFRGDSARGGAIDLPFIETLGEVAASTSASYDVGPRGTQRPNVFVPSSPRMVLSPPGSPGAA